MVWVGYRGRVKRKWKMTRTYAACLVSSVGLYFNTKSCWFFRLSSKASCSVYIGGSLTWFLASTDFSWKKNKNKNKQKTVLL